MGFKTPKVPNAQQPQAVKGVKVQSSAYGVALALLYGRNRVAGNVIWVDNFVATAHRHSSGSSKGGRVTTVEYSYTASVILALSEGPASSILTARGGRNPSSPPTDFTPGVWKIKRAMYATAGYGDPQAGFWAFATGPLVQGVLPPPALYAGTPYWQHVWNTKGQGNSKLTPDQWEHLAYPGICYVAARDLPLDSTAALPNFNFPEVGLLPYWSEYGTTKLTNSFWFDADPASIIFDILTDSVHGAGFPSSFIADLKTGSNSLSSYCRGQAHAILLSPLYDAQRTAADVLSELATVCNAALVFSEGLLKVKTYGDTASANVETGISFDPTSNANRNGAYIVAIYDLTDNDFKLRNAEDDPIRVKRTPQADVSNVVQIEYADAGDSSTVQDGGDLVKGQLLGSGAFTPTIAEAKDSAGISSGSGSVRAATPQSFHLITKGDLARDVAQRMLQRQTAIRNTYVFVLGWEHALLEPMDVVTVNDAAMNLLQFPVRITSIIEDADGYLEIEAEDVPIGVHHANAYGSQGGVGAGVDFNGPPGPLNPLTVFEPPLTLVDAPSGIELWIVTSGSSNWGGAAVWFSEDGVAYEHLGVLVNDQAHGALVADYPVFTNPDLNQTISVALFNDATLAGGTQAQADALAPQVLAYIGQGNTYELIAFSAATLVSESSGRTFYALDTYIVRAAHRTAMVAHTRNEQFALLKNAFKIPIDTRLIGRKVYVKLTSVNQYGAGSQDLGDVEAIEWTVAGLAQTTPLPQVTRLHSIFRDGLTFLEWDRVTDPRSAAVEYEVRFGDTWENGQILGTTKENSFVTHRAGAYWISAHIAIETAFGPVHVDSIAPELAVISAGTLVANIVDERSFRALGWPGFTSPYDATVLGQAPLFYFPGGDLPGVSADSVIGCSAGSDVTFTLRSQGSPAQLSVGSPLGAHGDGASWHASGHDRIGIAAGAPGTGSITMLVCGDGTTTWVWRRGVTNVQESFLAWDDVWLYVKADGTLVLKSVSIGQLRTSGTFKLLDTNPHHFALRWTLFDALAPYNYPLGINGGSQTTCVLELLLDGVVRIPQTIVPALPWADAITLGGQHPVSYPSGSSAEPATGDGGKLAGFARALADAELQAQSNALFFGRPTTFVDRVRGVIGLCGTTLFKDIMNVSQAKTIAGAGGFVPTGVFAPDGRFTAASLDATAPARLLFTPTLLPRAPFNTFATIENVGKATNILGRLARFVNVAVDVAIGLDAPASIPATDTAFGGWARFIPGVARVQRVRWLLTLQSQDPGAGLEVSDALATVDVEDRFESGAGTVVGAGVDAVLGPAVSKVALGSSIDLPVSRAIPAGRRVVLVVAGFATSNGPTMGGLSVVDTRGNAYAIDLATPNSPTAAQIAVLSASLATQLEVGDVITVRANTLGIEVCGWAFAGTGVLDVTAFNGSYPASLVSPIPAGPTNLSTGTTPTTTVAGDLVIAAFALRGNGADGFAFGGSPSAQQMADSDSGGWPGGDASGVFGTAVVLHAGVTVKAGTGTVTVNGTVAPGRYYEAVVLTYKPSGAGVLHVTFATPFNAVPNIQVTVVDAVAGDDVVLSNQSPTGFDLSVVNGGVVQTRDVNWIAQGY